MNSMFKYMAACVIYIFFTAPNYAQNNIAFVSNRESGDISIIDTSTYEVTESIIVGSKPRGMAINPSCSRLYVTLQESDEVVVINTKTKEIISRIQVGNEPFAVDVHPSGSPIYVSNWQDEHISVFDANYNRLTGSNIAIGKDQQVVKFNPSGTEACATHRGDRDSLSVISMKESDNFKDIPLGNEDSDPRDLVYHPSGKNIFIALRGNDRVLVMDAVNKSQISTIEVGQEPVNIVLSRGGSRAYVTNNNDHTVSVINLASDNEIIATVAVGQKPNGLEITPDGKHVFVANKNDTVSVIDTVSNEVIKTINVGKEPWDVAICQTSTENAIKDKKRIMQIYGNIYRKTNDKNILLEEPRILILDCEGKVQSFKSNPNGQYKILNTSGIQECKLKVKLNEVMTSWPPIEVIFSSKPRRYDLVF